MNFNKQNFIIENITLNGTSIEVRAFRNLIYVEKPVCPEFQQMNIFAPEAYYRGESINGYTIETAPVFMPNTVGGYMPGKLDEPGYRKFGPKDETNSIFRALCHGYVVAAPAIRGRIQKDKKGQFIGKAPACIVDYKAAVRYLHFWAKDLPGDQNKIITNGTSAGGALSSLMGATGNHPDYEPYLKELGAAEAGDEIYAASCYCPITNLEHADMAYEWQFSEEKTYHRMKMNMQEGGRPAFTPEDGILSDVQRKTTHELAKQFPEYVNSLRLEDGNGGYLWMNEKGEGTFLDYLKNLVLDSAQKAMSKNRDLSDKNWLTIQNNKAVAMDWKAYIHDITRMKTVPAFDSLDMDSPENDLFGSENEKCKHFTDYSYSHSLVDGHLAEAHIVKMLNPMNYIEDREACKAKHWRIRHGERDRDTSLAISAILAKKLQNAGYKVDYHVPWDVPHAGDYDFEELFSWIDSICRVE